MDKKRNKTSYNPLQWLNLMVSEPFYLFHFLLFFSYFVLRTSASRVLSPRITHRLLYREIQAILSLAVFAAIKIVRDETWEAFTTDVLLCAKVIGFVGWAFTRETNYQDMSSGRKYASYAFIVHNQFCMSNMLLLVAISLIMDYQLALWYIVVCAVIYILTQQPAFEGLGTSSKLTPLQLETLLTEGNTSRFWLVEFCVSSSSACICASRCFPELSNIYSNKNLSFGIVDLGLFPNAAEKFGISLSGGMSQLPTYILFESAAEVTRFPQWDFEAKSSHAPVTKRHISKHFELDRLLVEYLHGK